ncbi:MAG TPA: flagellar motor protein [Dissulfurispiraceae bacterium]|nr:flagellar motor protein [Dissulfurispiraceae bacterium]
MDIAAFVGILLGIGAVVGGNMVEGGNAAHLVQTAAAIIVFGGTLGATLLSSSIRDMFNAVKALGMVFGARSSSSSEVIEEILGLLVKARKMGLLSLESQVKSIDNDFLRKGLNLVIDGIPPAMIKDILFQEIYTYENTCKRAAKVFESAGGYAPTIGILGAVLGLIQVMRNVTEPSKIGDGIAVAFVATIYGVGSANLIFLPLGRKIINRLKEEVFIKELILEGVLGVEAGVNPYFLKARLNAFLAQHEKT